MVPQPDPSARGGVGHQPLEAAGARRLLRRAHNEPGTIIAKVAMMRRSQRTDDAGAAVLPAGGGAQGLDQDTDGRVDLRRASDPRRAVEGIPSVEAIL